MKRLLLACTAACLFMAASASTVNYTADNSTIFPNPERGFITMLEKHVTASDPYCVKGNENDLDKHMSKDKISLILVLYYLDNFKTTSTLPDAILNAFDEDMQVLRDKGLKCILRFAYTQSTYYNVQGKETADDATLAIAQSHISQYASHWQANEDVIFVFQAGIVGAWGEWYYSDHFGNQISTINDDRRALVNTLLDAVPANRCIQLRTPLFKTGYVGSTSPLTSQEAYANTPKARLAHHNDAFLENYGDMGTYSDTATQKPYLAQETLFVPIGGETCIDDADVAATNASYERTTAEMSRLHWTFIQSGFSTVVTNRWRENGTFDELNRRMGYRYQLISGTYSDETDSKLSVNIQLRNAGYAPLYNERHAYIVLRNESESYSLPLASDPRSWLPNGAVTTINEQLALPQGIQKGTYNLYLYLPDVSDKLADDPRYAVRFANSGVWDETIGMNKLNASVTITASQTPEPPVSGDAITLPATLNKANVASYSDDMTWFNSDYFDFGPNDAPNTERWAEWAVCLKYPGKYSISMTGFYPNGHQWQLQLLSADKTYSAPESWDEGDVTESFTELWDLSSVAAGEYTLRVQNIMEWSQPKFKSLTLQYDGELPTDMNIEMVNNPMVNGISGYDLLGRPVGKDYRGIVIRRGHKTLCFSH